MMMMMDPSMKNSFIQTGDIKIPVSCFSISKKHYIELHKLYYDDASSVKYQSFKKILNKTRELNLDIRPDIVKKFLESQNTYSIHTRQKRYRKFIPMTVYDINTIHQIDLAFFPGLSTANKNYIGILLIIDCFSKKAYYFPIKNTKSRHIGEILKKFYSRFAKKTQIQSDSGVEFMGYTAKVFKDLGMTHKKLTSLNKAAYVERLIRTVRSSINKLFSDRGDSNWIDHIEKIFQNYNNHVHSAIGIKPNEVKEGNSLQVLLNSSVLRKKNYEDEKILPLGAFVRTSIIEKKFHKGSWPVFSGEIFRISRRRLNFRPRQYALSDLNNCKIEGWFTNNDLKKLDYTFLEIHSMIEIEHFVREFKINGINCVEIKYRYYDNSFNSFVRKSLIDKFHVF